MASIRTKKTRNFTVMSNHHLKDKNLSLRAKGLLSLMLSLPNEWEYSVVGLSHICAPTFLFFCFFVVFLHFADTFNQRSHDSVQLRRSWRLQP